MTIALTADSRPIVAHRTLQAFEECVAVDQGAAYRVNLGRVLPHLQDAYDGGTFPFRSHMGASLMGGECGRKIWYSWRWHKRPAHKGQLLRLFNRGHLEEGRLIALLITAGIQVWQTGPDGKQFRISGARGHYGGSGDGVAAGVPDIPAGYYALLEFKTHSEKSFNKVKEEGVRSAKFEHYAQMQQYLKKMNLFYALYIAVNKNNDEIYAEIVPLDNFTAVQMIDRAELLVDSIGAPDKIAKTAGDFRCKWCDYKEVCHFKSEPDKNCRSCRYSNPGQDGKWFCHKNLLPDDIAFNGGEDVGKELDKDVQLAGCEHWEQV